MQLDNIILSNLVEINLFQEGNKPNAVLDHCLKVIDGMRRAVRVDSLRKGHIIGCRIPDPYLSLEPAALYEVFPILYENIFKKETRKTMNFVKMYCLIHGSGLDLNVSTDISKVLQKDNIPIVGVSFKLFDYSEWFKRLSLTERKPYLLRKDVIKITIADYLEPIIGDLEKNKESKIIIYGPDISKQNGYDLLRAKYLEEKIFEIAFKKYGKHSQLEFRKDKHIQNAINLLRNYCFYN